MCPKATWMKKKETLLSSGKIFQGPGAHLPENEHEPVAKTGLSWEYSRLE